MKVSGKRVVITGAASGIGKALAIAFQSADAKSIVCVDQNITEQQLLQKLFQVMQLRQMLDLKRTLSR